MKMKFGSKILQITNNKINSEKYYDAGQFYWGKRVDFLGKEKKIFSKLFPKLFFLKNPI